jgi:hypothetical protein
MVYPGMLRLVCLTRSNERSGRPFGAGQNVKSVACDRGWQYLADIGAAMRNRREGLRPDGDRMMRRPLAWIALLIIAVAVSGNLAVVVWDTSAQEKLGEIHFPISCNGLSQRLFDNGLARLHSLQFRESETAFAAIAEAEPDCAIAYWGIAMSRLGRPVAGVRAPDDVEAGRSALRSADKASLATERERDYIGALKLLFGEDERLAWDEHAVAYADAMEALQARYPNDVEARIFYALALNMATIPGDKNLHRQAKAAELLLLALSEQPEHPGLAHYLTYCLSLPTHEVSDLPDLPALSTYRRISQIQSALGMLALVGVSAFLVAVWPAWSRVKNV